MECNINCLMLVGLTITFQVSLNSLVRSDRFVGIVGLIKVRKISISHSNKFVNPFKFLVHHKR